MTLYLPCSGLAVMVALPQSWVLYRGMSKIVAVLVKSSGDSRFEAHVMDASCSLVLTRSSTRVVSREPYLIVMVMSELLGPITFCCACVVPENKCA